MEILLNNQEMPFKPFIKGENTFPLAVQLDKAKIAKKFFSIFLFTCLNTFVLRSSALAKPQLNKVGLS